MKTHKLIQTLSASLLLVSSAIVTLPAHAEGGHNNAYQTRNQNNGCAQYRLSSYGGESGFRLMNNQGDFRSTKNGSVGGQVCATGRVTLEIAKRSPNAHATVELFGRHYEFKQGDRGNKHQNGWFRRYYQVDLPQKTSHRGGYNHQGSRHAVVPVNTYNGYNNNHQGNYQGQPYSHGQNGHAVVPMHNSHGHQGRHHNNHGQNQEYLYGHLDNSQQYHQPQRFHNKSRKHRRAHRHDIPHQHHGRHFTFN